MKKEKVVETVAVITAILLAGNCNNDEGRFAIGEDELDDALRVADKLLTKAYKKYGED